MPSPVTYANVQTITTNTLHIYRTSFTQVYSDCISSTKMMMMILLVWQPVGWISLQTIYRAIEVQNHKIEIIQKKIKLQIWIKRHWLSFAGNMWPVKKSFQFHHNHSLHVRMNINYTHRTYQRHFITTQPTRHQSTCLHLRLQTADMTNMQLMASVPSSQKPPTCFIYKYATKNK